MAKNISKSIRISDEINDFIMSYQGNGFNEKFENIITFSMKTEMERKKRLNQINKLIEERSDELDKINKELNDARRMAHVFENLLSSLKCIR